MPGKPIVSFVSLGCFKNTVDTEVLGGMLVERGAAIVSEYEDADWLVINTCAFIRDAKEESIQEILAALDRKVKGETRHLAVFGCLVQRYRRDLQQSFAGVDILWGVNDLEELAEAICNDRRPAYADRGLFLYGDRNRRIVTTPANTTFIKISEGCDMHCSFCSIPAIRGPFRSRPIDSIVIEAERYRAAGVAELNLISQNSTAYGRDLAERPLLAELLSRLSIIGFSWIRVLYLMPEAVDEAMIEGFARPGVLPYFDLPFQHVTPKILKKMNRGGSLEKNLALVRAIRRRFPEAVIRSSFIVGFPGETAADFKQLLKFARDARIERIGVFAYSAEEGTPAFGLAGAVPPAVALRRREELLDCSDANLADYNRRLRGTTQEFLPQAPWDNNSTIGRIASQAPEVDGLTRLETPFDAPGNPLPVKIAGFAHELLLAQQVRAERAVPVRAERPKSLRGRKKK